MSDNDKLGELENKIGYVFQNKKLLMLALTHSSYANDLRKGKMNNNERLEFLGDAVLELVSSETLFQRYADKPEGDLTRLRASLVCEPTLAECARTIDLGSYLYLSRGEERTGGRKRDSVTSDAFEAVIGAIYLDGGYEPAKKFVQAFVLNDIEKKISDETTKKQAVLGEYANGNKIIHQLIDLALLQNNMLKGEALTNFVKRSIELI